MRTKSLANLIFVALLCADAHALLRGPLPALPAARTKAVGAIGSTRITPAGSRSALSRVNMVGWRLAAVTAGASTVVSTVAAVRQRRGKKRALRLADELNATVLDLDSQLLSAAQRQSLTDAELTRTRAKAEAAKVYGARMSDALEREQTARRRELEIKAKEARELASENYERQKELKAEIERERDAKVAAVAQGATLTAEIATLETTLAAERARLEAEATALEQQSTELSSQLGALEASSAEERATLERKIGGLDDEVATEEIEAPPGPQKTAEELAAERRKIEYIEQRERELAASGGDKKVSSGEIGTIDDQVFVTGSLAAIVVAITIVVTSVAFGD